MPKAEGAPHLKAYLVAAGGPPLCHSVTSPPARGGEGIRELSIAQAGDGSVAKLQAHFRPAGV